MVWFFLILTAVVIAAGASLAASWNSRRDLASGRPSFHSVADLTGIRNRTRLDELFGPRDGEDRYTVNAEALQKVPRTKWKRWFDREGSDIGCIALALAAALLIRSLPSIAWGLLAVSAVYLILGYLGALIAVLLQDKNVDEAN